MKTVYRPQYYLDYEAAMTYLAAEASAEIALRWDASLAETISLLETMPGVGRRRLDLKPPGLRSLPLNHFSRYLLFYRWDEDEDTVEVFGVIHGAMNLPALFQGRR
jgi:plasmid stabilization system protein ParE